MAMRGSISLRARSLQTMLAIVLFIAMAGTMFVALGFQYVIELTPCELCFMERTPYYIGVPLMLITAFLSATRYPNILVRGLFLILLLLMIYSFFLSVYHVGVEWKFWRGSVSCSFPTSSTSPILENITNMLDTPVFSPVSCSEAVGYFLGLSMGSWNAIVSLIYAAVSLFAACAHEV